MRALHAGWLADGGFGFLKVAARLHRGRWTRAGEAWTFRFTARDGVRLDRATRELEWLDDHWGARAALVFDPARRWRPERFRASRGHDAQPCALCASSISEAQPEHVRSEPRTLVCAACHARYLVTRSLAFVPGMPADDVATPPVQTVELPPLREGGRIAVAARDASEVGAAA
jgi:hypothetical protein